MVRWRFSRIQNFVETFRPYADGLGLNTSMHPSIPHCWYARRSSVPPDQSDQRSKVGSRPSANDKQTVSQQQTHAETEREEERMHEETAQRCTGNERTLADAGVKSGTHDQQATCTRSVVICFENLKKCVHSLLLNTFGTQRRSTCDLQIFVGPSNRD
jgi:hypothetical protein